MNNEQLRKEAADRYVIDRFNNSDNKECFNERSTLKDFIAGAEWEAERVKNALLTFNKKLIDSQLNNDFDVMGAYNEVIEEFNLEAESLTKGHPCHSVSPTKNK